MSFLWNSEKKSFLGRTGSSWVKILLFYLIFYACLIIFWVLCLIIALQTMNNRYPKWTSEKGSLIGKNPGLGVRPRPPAKSIKSTLIWFSKDKRRGNWGHWAKELTNFTDAYRNNSNILMPVCDYDMPPGEDKFCEFDLGLLGTHCNRENQFGYKTGRPCVLIKLNKIYGWKPKMYKKISELPKEMPSEVKDIIKGNFSDQSGAITKPNIWVSCNGQTPIDKANIGEIHYYPHPGLPSYYFPYTNVKGYQSPLVAVEFANVTIGSFINIECMAWAKNIEQAVDKRRGTVHFELIVDK